MNYKDINFTEEELFKLNIHELRSLARDIGVSSPTTKQKDDLVFSTLAIIYGEVPKSDSRAKAGRPARRSVKPSKLFLGSLDLEIENNETIDNPFVKMCKSDKNALFERISQDEDDYLADFFNPYSNSKVASSHVEYYSSKSKKNNVNRDEIVFVSDIEKAAKRMRELLGRTNENDSEENNEVDNIEDFMYVTGYVFLGAENKLYVSSPEDDIENQIIYLIPKRLVELFAIRVGDYITGWADEDIDVVLSLSSINGHIVE